MLPTLDRVVGVRSLIATLAAAGLAADAVLERGVASGVLYVGMVALGTWLPGTRATARLGAAASALTILGTFISPLGGPVWKEVANRLLALLAIWVTAALVWHHKRLIARQQQAEQRAVRSEQQFRAIVESNPAGMLLVDRNGRITLINREAERLLGYSHQELVGQTVETLVPEFDRMAHADNRAAFMANAESRRMGRGRPINGVTKQGREVSLEVGLVRIETSDGDFVLATLTDARERRLIENVRARRLAERRMVAAEDAQRKRMAREIHDALGQALTALKLDIGWLVRHLPADQTDLHARAVKMEELTTQTIDEVRRLSAELRPAILDDQGLLAAIRWQVRDFEKRTKLRCKLALPGEEIPLGSERSTVVYRVLQECLTNVARHADASKVGVTLWTGEKGDTVLEVTDDGRGISEEHLSARDALGLIGMRERALLHGGTLTLTGVAGDGTTVLLRMPSQADHDPEPGEVALQPSILVSAPHAVDGHD